jgi:hypothetical protein
VLYNDTQYNAEEYDNQVWGAGSIETLTLSDSDATKDVAHPLSDSLAPTDVIAKVFAQSARLESVGIADSVLSNSCNKNVLEFLTPTDSDITKNISQPLSDSTGVSDTVAKDTALDILRDIIFLIEGTRVHCAGMYNHYCYNEMEYNGTLVLAKIEKIFDDVQNDNLSMTDVQYFITMKSINEAITLIENFYKDYQFRLYDVIFLDEFFKKGISNKGLNEVIEIGDWLSLDPTRPNEWSEV